MKILPSIISLLMLATPLAGGQDGAARDARTEAVRVQLEAVGKTLGEKHGLKASRKVRTGTLAEGAEETLEIPLEGGKRHLVMAVCDRDCSDLNAVLYNAARNEVGKDDKDDDAPVVSVTPERSETYRFKVIMVKCAVEQCRYGVEVYSK